MTGVFTVRPSEITDDFVNMLKTFFKDRELVISTKDDDETDYLLSSKANKAALLQSIEDINRHSNLVSFKEADL